MRNCGKCRASARAQRSGLRSGWCARGAINRSKSRAPSRTRVSRFIPASCADSLLSTKSAKSAPTHRDRLICSASQNSLLTFFLWKKRAHFAVDIMRSAARFRRSTMSLPKICALKNWWIASIGKKFRKLFLRWPQMSKVKRPRITSSTF